MTSSPLFLLFFYDFLVDVDSFGLVEMNLNKMPLVL